MEKPSPPQKPLPADPLGRISKLGRSPLATHLPVPGSAAPIIQPNRPPLKQPPTLPKHQFFTGMKKPCS
ncbi:disintegrin and metalloproteinase domain-containing protein 12 [Tachysurus ichikawai]